MALPVPADKKGVVLSDTAIAGWAKSAGFPSEEIATAVAVALAESSGRIDAVGDGGKSYGLWQIHQPSHPALMTDTVEWWSIANANMAFQVWQQRRAGGRNGWSAWSTFNNGSYLLYMNRGRLATVFTDKPGDDQTAPVITTNPMIEIGNAIKGIAQGAFRAGAWVGNTQNILRAVQVAVGGAMVVGALAIVVRPMAAPVVSAVKSVR